MGFYSLFFGRSSALFTTFVLLLFFACAPARDGRYICADEGFSIRFPKEWEVVEKSRGTRILAEIPDQGRETFINQNVNVVVEDAELSVDLAGYVESQIAALKSLKGIEFSERSDDLIGGVRARCFSYGYAINDFGYRAVVYVMKHGEKFYVVTGISQRENYPALEPVFHEIARSVRFP